MFASYNGQQQFTKTYFPKCPNLERFNAEIGDGYSSPKNKFFCIIERTINKSSF